MRGLWLVLVLLVGCSTVPPAEAPETPVPVAWKDGQWWRYEVVDADGTISDVTLTAVVKDRTLLAASASEPLHASAADGFRMTGPFENWTWRGVVVSGNPLDVTRTEMEFQWLPPTLEKGTEWETGSLQGSVTEFDGINASLSFRFFTTTWGATYSLEAGWMQEIRLPLQTWRLVDHGTGYEAQRWLVEQSAANTGVLGTMTWSYPVHGSTHVRSTYTVACSEPGAVEGRLGKQRPIIEPIVSYQDVCPATATRVDWLPYDEPWIEVEVTGGHASGANPIDVGSLAIDGIRVVQV